MFKDALITALKVQALVSVSAVLGLLSALVVVWLSGVVYRGGY